MLLINDKLRASSEALDQLTKKLESSGKENKRLHGTIAALRKELENQKQRVLALSEELERKTSLSVSWTLCLLSVMAMLIV